MKNIPNKFRRISQVLSLTLLIPLSSSTFAIAYPNGEDCTNSNNYTSCAHQNVVMVSGFDSNGLTVLGTRCTATLIQKPTLSNPKYVFLTAAHCTVGWSTNPDIASLGVSFDPDMSANGNVIDISHFVTGGVGTEMFPISPTQYKDRGGIVKSDYSVVVYQPSSGDPIATKWPTIGTIPVATLPQDVNFSLDALVASTQDPKTITFSAVGYGIVELVKAPGTGGNAGGAGGDNNTLGTKRFSLSSHYRGLSETILKINQNPAQGFNGTCFGDSGGPNYYTTSTGQEIVVGVTSAGDAVCRAMGTNARIDIPEAISFISCVRDATSALAATACGV